MRARVDGPDRPSISEYSTGLCEPGASRGRVDQQSLFDEFGETVGDGCRARGDEPAGRAAAAAVGRLGDREVIVYGSRDDTVRIWDGESVTVVDAPTAVTAVALFSEGSRLCAATGMHCAHGASTQPMSDRQPRPAAAWRPPVCS
jgi:hypothetical protein